MFLTTYMSSQISTLPHLKRIHTHLDGEERKGKQENICSKNIGIVLMLEKLWLSNTIMWIRMFQNKKFGYWATNITAHYEKSTNSIKIAESISSMAIISVVLVAEDTADPEFQFPIQLVLDKKEWGLLTFQVVKHCHCYYENVEEDNSYPWHSSNKMSDH